MVGHAFVAIFKGAFAMKAVGSGIVMKITENYVDRVIKGKYLKPMYSALPEVQKEQEERTDDVQ